MGVLRWAVLEGLYGSGFGGKGGGGWVGCRLGGLSNHVTALA